MPDSKRGVQSGREVLDSTALEAIRSLQSDSAPRLLAQVVQIYLDSTPCPDRAIADRDAHLGSRCNSCCSALPKIEQR
jgi:hypothetical protein